MPTRTSEREFKLLVPDEFEIPLLADPATGIARAVEEAPLELTATYYDTPDLQLLAHRITVRRRQEAPGATSWTLKLPVTLDGTLREEVSVDTDQPDLPQDIDVLLRTVLLGDGVQPAAELQTQRGRWLLFDASDTVVAELTDDRVAVREGAITSASFRELEIEALGAADDTSLKKVVRWLRQAGARPEQLPKVERALMATRNGSFPAIGRVVRPGDPVVLAVQEVFRRQTRAMVAQAPRAFLGDPDGVHRMRIGQRHLRSIVRSFAPILDNERLVDVGKGLSQLGSFLGAVRDLDVFRERLSTEEPESSPLLHVIDARIATERQRLTSALLSPRYRDLIRSVRAVEIDDTFVVSSGTCEQELPPLVWKAAAHLRREGAKLTSRSPEQDFHEVRKLAKRARYTAESVAEFVSPRHSHDLSRFASRVAAVQNAFGHHQDATEARNRLLELAQSDFSTDGPMSLQIGRLVEKSDRDARKLRRKCLKAWDRLERDLGDNWLRI